MKLVWGLLIYDVLGSNLGAKRFLKNEVLLCSFRAQGQKIMFHVHAMGNVVNGVELVIKTWTFFILMAGSFYFYFIFIFYECLVLFMFQHGNLC
jgi:hypothetical protein